MSRRRHRSPWPIAVVLAAVAVVGVAGYVTLHDDPVKNAGQVVGYTPVPDPTPIPTSVTVASPTRILYVGDSLTDNWLASSADKGFRELLTARLHGAQAGVVARAGYTISQVLALLKRASPTTANLIVVEVGTNDLNQAVPVAASTRSYGSLLTVAADHAAAGAKLLCAGPWASSQAASTLERAESDLCHARGGAFVTLSEAFADAALRGPQGSASYIGVRDDSHPNDAGHQEIARLLAADVHAPA